MTEPDEFAREDDLAIRRMRDDPGDYHLMLRWRTEPHVAEWWNTDDDTEGRVVEHYRPYTEPSSATVGCIVTTGDRAVGYVQFYRWADYADELVAMDLSPDESGYGMDILIGEPDLVGRGVGSRTVMLLCRYLFEERGATSVSLITAEANVRAQHAYEKAGLRTIGRCLDTDTRNGERIPSLFMAIDHPLA
jgi:aminoglycoside 6'-N-acetyltransferase